MADNVPTREQAWTLLTKYNETDRARRHALGVEAVMRYLARKQGEDEEVWGVIGLVHDLDYEKFPNAHCKKTEEILVEHRWPPEWIRAVVSHGWGLCSDVEPKTTLEKTLYAVDELCGLVAATALVRPSKSVLDMKAKSVKNKWKDKHFAAGVDRALIEKGAAMMGVELGDLITDVIMGMRERAADLGLAGTVES